MSELLRPDFERVNKEMRDMIARFPSFEPESIKLQPFMVPFSTLTGWADAVATIDVAAIRAVAEEMQTTPAVIGTRADDISREMLAHRYAWAAALRKAIGE